MRLPVSCLDEVFQGIYHGKCLHKPDILQVLQRAQAANIDKIMLTASSQQDLEGAIQLIPQIQEGGLELKTTVGVHPCRVKELEANQEMLSAIIAKAKGHTQLICAVGEIGLDYDRLEYAPAELQSYWFERQMQVLLEAFPGYPLFLHMRAAIDDFAAIIRKHRDRFEHGVAHSFTGTLAELETLLSLNLHIGLNGW